MDNLNEFLTNVLFPALLTIFTTVISLVAAISERRRGKKDKAEEEKEAQESKLAIVETCVNAIEQTRKDIHGEEKLKACLDGVQQMLAIKGIAASEFELKMLIEAELAERNHVFNELNSGTLEELTSSNGDGGACPLYFDPDDLSEVD